MTRRPPHGGTTRPPLARPGNGFGRPVRPGPLLGRMPKAWRDPALSVDTFLELLTLGEAGGAGPTERLDQPVN